MKEFIFGAEKGKIIQFEPYYLSLKNEEILESPIFCSAMSMFHSFSGRIKESEYCFNNLIEMKKQF